MKNSWKLFAATSLVVGSMGLGLTGCRKDDTETVAERDARDERDLTALRGENRDTSANSYRGARTGTPMGDPAGRFPSGSPSVSGGRVVGSGSPTGSPGGVGGTGTGSGSGTDVGTGVDVGIGASTEAGTGVRTGEQRV